jgi:hypothetical protein
LLVAGFNATELGKELAGTVAVTQSAHAVPTLAATARQTASIPILRLFADIIVAS